MTVYAQWAYTQGMTPDEIRALRRRLDLTQSKLAALVGAKLRTVQHWEKGDRTPRGAALMLLERLARRKPKETEP